MFLWTTLLSLSGDLGIGLVWDNNQTTRPHFGLTVEIPACLRRPQVKRGRNQRVELGDDGGEGDHPNWAELIVFLKPATKLGETILKKEKYFELI